MGELRYVRRQPPPYKLIVLPVVGEDLQAHAGDLIKEQFLATVEQYKTDQDKLGNLLKNFYGETYPDDKWTHDIGVRRIVEYLDHEPSREVWRFKIWNLENRTFRFRFFYCYFERARAFFILGAAPRDDETYAYNSPHGQRVAADYDKLCVLYG